MSERDRREPEWSEHQRDLVEAMQPRRSDDPDSHEDPTIKVLEQRIRWQSQRLVQIEQMVANAVYLAELVQQMDFSGHIHFTWAPCDHCIAKRCANEIVKWRESCMQSTPS